MLATVWLDVVFVPLLVLGVEPIAVAEGEEAGCAPPHPCRFHPLARRSASALGSPWLGGARRWGSRAGWIRGGVSFSHWLLDLLFHRAEMPWLPAKWGELPRLGLGLRRLPALGAAIEAALVVLAKGAQSLGCP